MTATDSEPYRLRITEFPAVLNIYTGVVQGGPAYGTIIGPDDQRVELEFDIDQQYLDDMTALGIDDAWHGYRVGEPTTRLRNREHVLALARSWMAEYAPDAVLANEWYDDEIYYPAAVQA